MSTTLSADFLVAVSRMSEFKREKLLACKAELLALALQGRDFTAAELTDSATEGSPHRAGAATGALISIGLLAVVGRVKSPKESAKGRKLDLLRLAPGKYQTVLTWFRANGLPINNASEQQVLAFQ